MVAAAYTSTSCSALPLAVAVAFSTAISTRRSSVALATSYRSPIPLSVIALAYTAVSCHRSSVPLRNTACSCSLAPLLVAVTAYTDAIRRRSLYRS